MASKLSGDEEQATKKFLEDVTRQHPELGPIPWTTGVKFLMARKFDVKRAIELYHAHQDTRTKEDLILIDPQEPRLRRELFTEKFTILASPDSSGASIALFTARRHRPYQTTHRDTLKGLVFQLDTALERVEAQRNGLVFIYDMTESKYNNFDYELSIKILNMLKGAYPARLKKVLIVTAPLWFKAPFKILRLFVREKLRDRVHTVNKEQLPIHIPLESLPRSLGGLAEVNHRDWLRHCLLTLSNLNMDPNCVETFFANATHDTAVINSPSPTGSENFTISDMESEDSHETVPEKHNNEDREKEVEVEKEDNLNKKMNGEGVIEDTPPCKRGSDTSPSQSGDQAHGNLPRKKRPSSNMYEDSIHMPEAGGMTVEELVKYVRQRRKNGLVAEYMSIKCEPPAGTFLEAKKKQNACRNRYTDVLCMDHSRVKLTRQSEDYINANFVDGYRQKNAYINTQGPLPKTFPDFWDMIWEESVVTIVMTTRTIERSRIKCGQYWPKEEETAEQYGDFVVINCGIEKTRDYTVTSLVLQNVGTGESREVTHLQFTSWPDYGVPRTAAAFLDFLFRVRQCQQDAMKRLSEVWTGHPLGPPIVVHCSAGIGRTGTFCTIDISIHRLADIGTVDVEKTVRRIRSQRAFSIQMPDQYVFSHLALLEHAQREGLIGDIDLEGFEERESESD
ncbi:tyrosine-protein phosphatase non-receptor type 9-like isoform X2 [Lineus longissimus]|uniref:tyrosine-protein phosphatase non-receptor type 9-like isoform X2 n=1 Tax=Lineus longissimus TaxID=88925 RepID=UPI00315D8A31